MIQEFEYMLTGISLMTTKEDIFYTVYNKYKDYLRNGCFYDEGYGITIRLDMKNMIVYVYAIDVTGVDFEYLLESINGLSNVRYSNSNSDLDWEVLRKDYKISFYADGEFEIHTTDNGLFVDVDEDDRIHMLRTKYIGDSDHKRPAEVIAPVITDIEELFLQDFKATDNKVLSNEFQKLVDDIYKEEIIKGERGCGDSAVSEI